MATLSTNEAVEQLAKVAEKADPTLLQDIYGELFPAKPVPTQLSATELAHHIRTGLVPEEIVDLWNAFTPTNRRVWYNEVDNQLYYNEETFGYAGRD